jgi:hypothetical protein
MEVATTIRLGEAPPTEAAGDSKATDLAAREDPEEASREVRTVAEAAVVVVEPLAAEAPRKRRMPSWHRPLGFNSSSLTCAPRFTFLDGTVTRSLIEVGAVNQDSHTPSSLVYSLVHP